VWKCWWEPVVNWFKLLIIIRGAAWWGRVFGAERFHFLFYHSRTSKWAIWVFAKSLFFSELFSLSSLNKIVFFYNLLLYFNDVIKIIVAWWSTLRYFVLNILWALSLEHVWTKHSGCCSNFLKSSLRLNIGNNLMILVVKMELRLLRNTESINLGHLVFISLKFYITKSRFSSLHYVVRVLAWTIGSSTVHHSYSLWDAFFSSLKSLLRQVASSL